MSPEHRPARPAPPAPSGPAAPTTDAPLRVERGGRGRGGRKPPQPPFVLPLADRTYDRTPSLRPSEVMALRAFAERERTRRANAAFRTPPELDRLVAPLADVAGLHRVVNNEATSIEHAAGAQRSHTRFFVRRVLLTMHTWHEDKGDTRTFWAWGRDAWLAMCDKPYGPTLHASPTLGAAAAAYLFSGVFLGGGNLDTAARVDGRRFSRMLFGDALERAYAEVTEGLKSQGFSVNGSKQSFYFTALIGIALAARSPRPEDWRPAHVETAAALPHLARAVRRVMSPLVRTLERMGYDVGPMPAVRMGPKSTRRESRPEGVPEAWWALINRWYATSPSRASTRKGYVTVMQKFARWLGVHHATVKSPAQLTRSIALEYVGAVVNDWKVQDRYAAPARGRNLQARRGDPLEPAGVLNQLSGTRTVLRDVEDWGWAKLKFRPEIIAAPAHIREGAQGVPRDINPVVFAKLVWAALNLTAEDLVTHRVDRPLSYVRAAAILWAYSALRRDELCRLAAGCARYATDWSAIPDGPFAADEIPPAHTPAADAVAPAGYLLVPDNKTSRSFVKAINPAVVRAVHAWERERPPGQEALVDATARRRTAYLFQIRGKRMGQNWVNQSVIPMLCAKMGVPIRDERGQITSHRARHSIASMLLNAPDGMDLEALAAWLGHKSTKHTRRYARMTPARQAEQLARAEKHIVQVDVVLDLEAVGVGDIARALWYDLGHGWCRNKFFALCAHRMACARCGHYKPKPESGPVLLQLQRNHVRLKQEIELRPEELAAMEGDDAAVDQLLENLRDTPTADGRTPRELDVQRASQSPATPDNPE